MYLVTKRIDFCYGHRLLDYDGICKHPHGHNAVAEIEIRADVLDARNMVADFSDIKRVVKGWIDRELDHRMILRRDDPLVLEAVAASTERALDQASIARSEVDLFELHDAYTIMSALTLESAGFARPGTAGRLAAEGRLALDGDLPIATFGGLKARGHPVGATGCYQLVEAYLQLTEAGGANQVRGAELALVQNMGGTGATVVSHVLRRVA